MTILKIDTSKIGFGNYCSPQTFGYSNSTNLSIVSIAATDAVGTRCHIALICGLVKLLRAFVVEYLEQKSWLESY